MFRHEDKPELFLPLETFNDKMSYSIIKVNYVM